MSVGVYTMKLSLNAETANVLVQEDKELVLKVNWN